MIDYIVAGIVGHSGDCAEEALDAAGRQATAIGAALPRKRKRRTTKHSPGLSSAHPDGRDPQDLASALASIVQKRGWDKYVTVGSIDTRWEEIAGDSAAAHSRPETFVDGVLTIRTSSTAWAQQLNWLSESLLDNLERILGENIVTSLVIVGPKAPSWTKGPLRVKGRGPRDTYG